MGQRSSRTGPEVPVFPKPKPPLQPVRVPRPGRPWTVADLEGLGDDENRYELVRGDLLMMTPASPMHGSYAARLISGLGSFVEEHDLGEVMTAEPGFLLQPEPEAVVRAPDVAFVSKARLPPKDLRSGFWPMAPDLAVEIISPSESAIEIREKLDDYLAAGVRLVWVVYPESESVDEYRSGQVKRLGLQDSLEGGEVVPGFTYRLTRLFR